MNLNLNLFLFYNGYKLGRITLFIWPLIQNYYNLRKERERERARDRERERESERDREIEREREKEKEREIER